MACVRTAATLIGLISDANPALRLAETVAYNLREALDSDRYSYRACQLVDYLPTRTGANRYAERPPRLRSPTHKYRRKYQLVGCGQEIGSAAWVFEVMVGVARETPAAQIGLAR